jgi:hypothetical protein
MSANPQAMAQMLASSLGGQGQAPMVGGVQTSQPLGGAAQLMQKIMLMKALQGQPQQPQPPAALPGMPQPPAAMPMPGGVNA